MVQSAKKEKQMTTSELRKALKQLGYKISITSSSLGRYAQVTHLASGYTFGNVEPSEGVKDRWGKFEDYVNTHRDELKQWAAQEGVFGTKDWFSTRYEQLIN